MAEAGAVLGASRAAGVWDAVRGVERAPQVTISALVGAPLREH